MAGKRKDGGSWVRNFTFGVEDSLASTVGLLSGIASANVGAKTVIVTGFVLIAVEALSMGVGSFLSEQSVSEYKNHRDLSLQKTLPGALIMFFSYLAAGLIPIAPYALFDYPVSVTASVVASIAGLAALGWFNARVAGVRPGPSVIRMMLLGGLVTVAGVLVGKLAGA